MATSEATLALDDGRCPECSGELPSPKATGRPRQFCCDRCQRRYYKRKSTNGTHILRYSERPT
jgi:tRNA(Ile2) C34 agmatinyltransferase TiaS